MHELILRPEEAIKNNLIDSNSKLELLKTKNSTLYSELKLISDYFNDSSAILNSNPTNIDQALSEVLNFFYDQFSNFFRNENQQIDPQHQDLLSNFLPQGKFLSTLPRTPESSPSDLFQKLNMMKSLFEFLTDLICIAENDTLPVEERRAMVSQGMQIFPGGSGADFACIGGTSSRIHDAHKSISTNYQHAKDVDNVVNKYVLLFSKLTPQGEEVHLPKCLLSFVAIKEIEKILAIDPNIHFALFNIKTPDLYDFLLEFQSEKFSKKLEEKIDLVCRNFEEKTKDLKSEDKNFESVLLGQNANLIDILKEFSLNLFTEQPIFLQKSDLDLKFFFSSEPNEMDRKLLNKEQLKEKIIQSYREHHPQLFDQSSIDDFKYLPSKDELFSTTENGVEFLDIYKIENLINLFQKVQESDTEEEKKIKLSKYGSGILVLNLFSSNCSRFDNIYLMEFLKKFQEKNGEDFFQFHLQNEFLKNEYEPYIKVLKKIHSIISPLATDAQSYLRDGLTGILGSQNSLQRLDSLIDSYQEDQSGNEYLDKVFYHSIQIARSDLLEKFVLRVPDFFKQKIVGSAQNNDSNFLHKILQNDDDESLKLLLNFINTLPEVEKHEYQGHFQKMVKDSNFIERSIFGKRVKLLETLIEYSEIDFNSPTISNKTPLQRAMELNSYEVLDLFLSHEKIDKKIYILQSSGIGIDTLNILDFAMKLPETVAFRKILEHEIQSGFANQILTKTDRIKQDSTFHSIISTDREELLNIFLSKVSCDDLNYLIASYSEQQNYVEGDSFLANLIFYDNKKNLFLIAKKYDKEQNGRLTEFMELRLPNKFENVFVENLFLNDPRSEYDLMKILEPELLNNLFEKNSELISKLMVSEVIETNTRTELADDLFGRPGGAQERTKKANNLARFTALLEKLDEPRKSDFLEKIFLRVIEAKNNLMKENMAKMLQSNTSQDTNQIKPVLALEMFKKYLNSDLDNSQKQTKIEKLVFALNENELGEFIDIIKDLERFNEIEPNFSEKTKKLIKIYATKSGKFDIILIEDDLSGSDNELPTPPRNIKLSNLASSINLNESDNEFTKLCNEFLDSKNPKIKTNQLKFIKDLMSIESAMDPEELKEQITNEYAPDDDRMKAEFRIKINEVISTFSITSSSPSPIISERMSLDFSIQRPLN